MSTRFNINKISKKNLSLSINLFCLLIVNTVNIQTFNFGGWPIENGYQLLLSFFFISGIFSDNKIRVSFICIIIGFFGILLGLFSFYKYNDSNFNSCFETDFTSIANFENSFVNNDPCQFSYEFLFNPNITRTDRLIDFYSISDDLGTGLEFTNWNLHFFNQTGFNFYNKNFYGSDFDSSIKHWWGEYNGNIVGPITGTEYINLKKNNKINDYFKLGIVYLGNEPSRSWMPFRVSFYNDNYIYKDQLIKIEYIGEVTYKINNNEFKLQPNYLNLQVQEIFLEKGTSFSIDYIYRYSPEIGNHPGAPYAHLRLLDENNEPVNPFVREITQNDEQVIIVLFFLMLFAYSTLYVNKQNIYFLILSIILFFICFLFLPSRFQGLIFLIITIFLLNYFFEFNKISRFELLISTILTTLLSTQINNFNFVKYTYGGGDALKYESWAQQIFIDKSLQGGEDIFFYMPGYRYLLSLLRSFFGDSHSNLVIFYTFMILFILFQSLKNYKKTLKHKSVSSAFVILSYVIFFSFSVKSNVLESYSEWPTWILLLFLLLNFKIFSFDKLILIPIIMAFIRPNQYTGVIILILILLIENKEKLKLKHFFGPVLIFFLPFIHNFVYGEQFIFNKNAFESGSYYITPIELIKHFLFIEKSEMVIFHTNYLLANPLNNDVVSLGGFTLVLVLNLTLVLFLISNLILIVRRKYNIHMFVLNIAPVMFLVLHLIYQVHTYYPRHIIVGYLTMLFMSLNNVSQLLEKQLSE